MEFCLGFFLFGLVLVGLGIVLSYLQGRQVDAAKRAYHLALEDLRASPNDPLLRGLAVEMGRAFVRLAAQPNVFSEVTIMNDVQAACAGASGTASLRDRLQALEQLHRDGILSEEDFDRGKDRLLGGH